MVANHMEGRLTGVILAGGRSTRMGGNDKAFVVLAGRPLLEHVIERLAPQVERLAISSNAPAGRFASCPFPVLPDLLTGFRGPLAGIHAALSAYPEDLVLTVAVDLPFLPADLALRLRAALRPGRCAYATDGHHHALAVLWSPGSSEAIARSLESGRTSLHGWLETHGDPVAFLPTDRSDVSFNVNSPEDLARAEARFARD
jgi:molybdopterin-guanine dinucleotide biosynthesis protein A